MDCFPPAGVENDTLPDSIKVLKSSDVTYESYYLSQHSDAIDAFDVRLIKEFQIIYTMFHTSFIFTERRHVCYVQFEDPNATLC